MRSETNAAAALTDECWKPQGERVSRCRWSGERTDAVTRADLIRRNRRFSGARHKQERHGRHVASDPDRGQWTLRGLRLADGPAILKLSQNVFGSSPTLAQWHWQFADNPFGAPIVVVAEADGGVLVGHFALVPLPYLRDGRRCRAALSVQSMVHPAFQRRGMLKLLADVAVKRAEDEGLVATIAFLNDRSVHAYRKHFGWSEPSGSNFIHVAALDVGETIRSLVRRRLGRDTPPLRALGVPMIPAPRPRARYRIRTVARFDERADALWRSFALDLRFSVDRSATFLNWRTSDVRGSYTRFVAEEGNALAGIVITRTEEKFGIRFGYVVELFFETTKADAGTELLTHALEHLHASGCCMATAVTSGSGAIARALRRSRFVRLPRRLMPHGIHFCAKQPGASNLPRAAWFLSWLDHDVV